MKNILACGALALSASISFSALAAENVMDSRTYLLDQSNKESSYPDFGGSYVEVLVEYVVSDDPDPSGRVYDYFRFTVSPLVALSGKSAGIKSFGFNTIASACPFGGVVPMDPDSLPEGYFTGISPCYGEGNYNTQGGFGKFDAMPWTSGTKDVVETLVFTVDAFNYDHDNDASTPSVPLPIDFYAVAGEGGPKEGAWAFTAEVVGLDNADGGSRSAIFAGHQ